ncbi:hypothetical protein FS749_001702 [Ceratobasidium sp. UAMH 11750]|nr:hypothetical protein FS749_001702 [Ceratobasidium sp. UAMH 11750]
MNEAPSKKPATYSLPKDLNHGFNLKPQTGECCINKLPPELLLRIFALGDEEQRAKRKEGAPYYGFQDLVTQVCTHWRYVAINNPALWTYIYVSRPPPHNSAALYLGRSGSASLLDIDLEMEKSFFGKLFDSDDWVTMTFRAKRTIECLVQYGATTSRWNSLMVRAGIPQILYKSLEYIHPKSASALRFLSLEWRVHDNPDFTFRNEHRGLAYPVIFDNVYPNAGDRFPQLHHAEFNRVPTHFLLGRPLPMLVGLTHLKLASGFNLISHGQLHDLLSANPQLESLDISIGLGDSNDFEPTDRQVILPSLRSLVITSRSSPSWAQGIIKMINGPAIEHLKLSGSISQQEAAFRLAKQIVDRTIGSGADAPSASTYSHGLSHQQVYPSLRHLDIGSLCPGYAGINASRDLFSILPTITSLTAPAKVFVVLRDQPWLLPQLEWVTIPGEPPEELGDVLRCREEGGCPVKTLEIQEQYLNLIRNTLPESLAIVKLTLASEVYYDSTNGSKVDGGNWGEGFNPEYDDYDDSWLDEDGSGSDEY